MVYKVSIQKTWEVYTKNTDTVGTTNFQFRINKNIAVATKIFSLAFSFG